MVDAAQAADRPSLAGELDAFEVEDAKPGYTPINFRADAALIRELGERLVGAPHIALAELVKNAYDADATKCVITLDPTRITVSDNGHGMTKEEFSSLWMTIGSTHKRQRNVSRLFQRMVTGSKGVGRLAAQFLAHRLQIFTKSEAQTEAIHALVDWDQAATAGGLTEAKAKFRAEGAERVEFPDDSLTGTTVVLEWLNQTWDRKQVAELGRALWQLNSPFPRFGRVATGERADAFEIDFRSSLPGYDEQFAARMRAALDNWEAAIEGNLRREGDKCVSTVDLRFSDGDTYKEEFDHPALIAECKWQIRVYRLIGRQAGGISVSSARDYFRRFGVMLFDSGFRLPYYGVHSDWLKIDRDHSLRLSQSKLLPARLQEDRGLNDLPQQERLIGVVSVNTGFERDDATDAQKRSNDYFLQISVTRDRLIENPAFETLTEAVRQSLDYYATRYRAREARRQLFDRIETPPAVALRRVEQLIEEVARRFPLDDAAGELKREFRTLDLVVDQQRRADDAARALLGPLASAGMAAIALQHENRREIATARHLIRKLRDRLSESAIEGLDEMIGELESWLDRLAASSSLFSPLLEDDERERATSMRAGRTVREIVGSLGPLLPRVAIEIDIPKDLRLPAATYAEWHALFQNVLTNASNSMLDRSGPRMMIRGSSAGGHHRLLVSDIGVGIDLEKQSKLFEPFGREQRISEERAALGLGGMGLGLTIVRMIADQRHCTARFVAPEPGWNTTFALEWTADEDADPDL